MVRGKVGAALNRAQLMDVVWFAEIKWDYLRTRKQQIIRRRPDDVRVLFLEPFVRGRKNYYGVREIDGIRAATIPFVKAIPGGLARRLVALPVVRALVDARAARRTAACIGSTGFQTQRALGIISNIYAVRVAVASGLHPLVYDCNDAHGEFPGMAPWTYSYFARACRQADAVFVTASALRPAVIEHRGRADGVDLLGNGVDFEHFDRVRRESSDPTSAQITVGYLGAIAPWFDFDAVNGLARSHPDWRIELVGPVMLGVEGQVRRLAECPNVRVSPPVGYDDVPRAIRGWSVGLIPFHENALTRAVNPNKMYEYLAMGCPVAATPFSAEVKAFPREVSTPQERESFVDACERALEWGRGHHAPEFRDRAVAIARHHDWSNIAATFWMRARKLSEAGGN